MLKFDKNATTDELTTTMQGIIKFDLDEGLFAAKTSAAFLTSTSDFEFALRLEKSLDGEATPLIGSTV